MAKSWTNFFVKARQMQYEIILFKKIGFLKAILNVTVFYCFMNAILLKVVLRTKHFGEMMNPMTISIIRRITNLIDVDSYTSNNDHKAV